MTQSRVKYDFTLILLIVSVVFAQGPSSFVVFEDLRPLIIFNSYEQQLSQKEKEDFPQYSVFLIRNDRFTLSDNFSIASAIEIEGRKFYILLDSQGYIKNLDQAGEVHIYRKTELINDTLVIKKENTVFIRDPIKNKRHWTLTENDQVIRIFRYKSREYVRLLESPVFGWLEVNDRSALERLKFNSPGMHGLSESEISQIEHSIQRVNNQIKDIFNLLNKKTGQSLAAPQWRLRIFDNKIECYIDKYKSELEPTGLQLQVEIQQHLRTREYQVSGSADHFAIEFNK